MNLKTIPIVSIFDVMNKVRCPKVYDKWCIIHDVVMQIL